ncbi:MAG TPA: transglycosylase domain-containing protein [Streptosporangiaceae bacterium]
MSNEEFPSPYRPDRDRDGSRRAASRDYRDWLPGRSGREADGNGSGGNGGHRDGGGRADRGSRSGWGANGSRDNQPDDYQPRGYRPSGPDGNGDGGPRRPWSRSGQAGRSSRGQSGQAESRFWNRPEGSGSRRTPWDRRNGGDPGAAGVRGTSASRERYAAARERYAARVGGTGTVTGPGRNGTGYPGTGNGGPGHNGHGPGGNGYHGNGSGGNGPDGDGYDGPGYGGPGSGGPGSGRAGTGYLTRRRPTGQFAPDHRRVPGRTGDGGGRSDRRPRRKGDWWRHWTWRKALTLAAALCGLLAMAAALGVMYIYSKTPIPQPQQAAFQAASSVYFSDGKTQIGQFGTYDRQVLTYNQIPVKLRDAVVAAEDKNFWHEGGISPTGILRAAYYDLTSSSGSLQGASTITQQLVRNFYDNIGTSQTISRKIKEIFVAQKLAASKSKEWILQQYLNTVYFGAGAYGVGAAAQVYFGLSPSQLNQITYSQAAMIASMIQSPSYYSPDPKDGTAYTSLVYRWKYVLGAMAKMGTISPQAEHQALAAGFPKVVQGVNNSWGGYRGFIMQAVLNELQTTYHYSKQQIFNGGLRITTTFNKRLMDNLYATVAANRLLMRKGTPPTPPYQTQVPCGAAGCLPSYVHIGAVLEQPGTGAILAMYSGKNYNKTQYDDALDSRNQVGSSFKPYVLATAVKMGMNVQTSRLNGFSPLWIPPDSSPTVYASTKTSTATSWFEVHNDEVTNPNRPVSVVEATALSLNTAYADLWHRVAVNQATGAHNVTNMAQAFGVDTRASGMVGGNNPMQDEAGIALGQGSLTVEEQTTMMATLAAGGEYVTPHVIKKITVGNQVIRAKVIRREVLTPEQAAEVDYALSFDMSSLGTANGLGLTNGQTVIAKTGTTNLGQSAFFLGATQRYAMAVGMFVSKPFCSLPVSEQYLCTSTSALAFTPPPGLQTLYGVGGLPGYGGGWPTVIWHDYFMKEFNSLPAQAWPTPNPGYGSMWNLVGPNEMPKPHHDHGGGGQCHHQGRRCQGGGGGGGGGGHHSGTLPSPPPTPTATATARTTASVGGVAVGGIMATGVMVALAPTRLRRRPARRRKGPAG